LCSRTSKRLVNTGHFTSARRLPLLFPAVADGAKPA
jgi:hypothetical protein